MRLGAPFSLHGFPAPFRRRFPARPLALSQFLLRAVRSLAKIGVLRQHFLLASPVGAVVSAAFRGHRRVSHADGHAVFKVQRAKRQQKSRHKTDQPCLRFFWKVMLVGYVTAESQNVQPHWGFHCSAPLRKRELLRIRHFRQLAIKRKGNFGKKREGWTVPALLTRLD